MAANEDASHDRKEKQYSIIAVKSESLDTGTQYKPYEKSCKSGDDRVDGKCPA